MILITRYSRNVEYIGHRLKHNCDKSNRLHVHGITN